MNAYDRYFYQRTWQKKGYAAEPELVQRVLSLVARESARSLLDVGCGNGSFLHAVLEAHPNITSVGVDFAASALAGASPAVTCQADVTALPFRAESFDVVTCLEVLEHVMLCGALLSEMARVCKPEGRVIIVVPNFAQLQHRLALLLGNYPDRREHVHAFTFDRLRDALDGHGLQLRSLSGDFVTIPLFWPIVKWNIRAAAGARLFPRLASHIIAVCGKGEPSRLVRG